MRRRATFDRQQARILASLHMAASREFIVNEIKLCSGVQQGPLIGVIGAEKGPLIPMV